MRKGTHSFLMIIYFITSLNDQICSKNRYQSRNNRTYDTSVKSIQCSKIRSRRPLLLQSLELFYKKSNHSKRKTNHHRQTDNRKALFSFIFSLTIRRFLPNTIRSRHISHSSTTISHPISKTCNLISQPVHYMHLCFRHIRQISQHTKRFFYTLFNCRFSRIITPEICFAGSFLISCCLQQHLCMFGRNLKNSRTLMNCVTVFYPNSMQYIRNIYPFRKYKTLKISVIQVPSLWFPFSYTFPVKS